MNVRFLPTAIIHNGGPCPVPLDTIVQVETVDGTIMEPEKARLFTKVDGSLEDWWTGECWHGDKIAKYWIVG